MSLPLLITDDEHVPIYLQIVHQIRYLVTGRELSSGDQLPSVRQLAVQLGVNAGTVAQAYRILQEEGLINSQRGRGTYVTPLADESTRMTLRQELLTEAMNALSTRAFALGYGAAELRQHFTSHLLQSSYTLPFVLAGPTKEAAEKYGTLVASAFPENVHVSVISCTLEELENGHPSLLECYKTAFLTGTFLSLVPRVETELRRHGVRSEVIGLTARVTDATLEHLRSLGPGGPYALATEERNVNAALGIIAQHAAVDLRSIRVLTERSSSKEWQIPEAELVLHTFGVTALLDENGVSEERRLELSFTLSEESRAHLSRLVSNEFPVST